MAWQMPVSGFIYRLRLVGSPHRRSYTANIAWLHEPLKMVIQVAHLFCQHLATN